MKSILLALVAFFIVTNNIQSQELGIQLVSGITRLRNPGGSMGDDPIFSCGFNGKLLFGNNSRFFLSLELGYIQKGSAKQDYIIYKFDILSMPIVLGVDLYKKFYFVAGVELDKPIKIREKTSNGDLISEIKLKNAREFPLIIGFKKQINSDFSISLRYTHSFTYITRNLWSGEIADYNQSLHLAIAYRLVNFN